MPIFEYQCDDCENVFEELVFSSSKTSGVKCPQCGGVHTQKLFSAFASAGASGGGCGGGNSPFT